MEKEMFNTIIAGLCLIMLIMLAAVALPLLFPGFGLALALLAVVPATRPWALKKAFHLWIAFDKFANAMRFHDHRETISSCLGKSIYFGHPPVFNWLFIDRFIGRLLDAVDPLHCKTAIDWTVGRDQHWRENQYSL